jgi:LacI family transcriptional regulator
MENLIPTPVFIKLFFLNVLIFSEKTFVFVWKIAILYLMQTFSHKNEGLMLTLREIALASGYSIAVVSRVLSSCPHEEARVAEKTRLHIREVAQRLGYRPNRGAEFLKRGGSPVIAVYMPDIAEAHPAELAKGISMEAGFSSFPLSFFYNSTNDGFQRFIRESIDLNNSGVIACPSFLFDAQVVETVEMYCSHGGRMVMINNFGRCSAEKLISVDIDDFSGGMMAAERLLFRGCRRFLTISNQLFPLRHEGFCCKIENAGKNPEMIASVREFDIEKIVSMMLAMHQNRSNLPIGIFATSDREAVEILTMLARSKVKVGRDFLIIGYGNQYLSAHVHPGLTTVALPLFAAGQSAVSKLAALIYKKDAENEQLAPELIIRESA